MNINDVIMEWLLGMGVDGDNMHVFNKEAWGITPTDNFSMVKFVVTVPGTNKGFLLVAKGSSIHIRTSLHDRRVVDLHDPDSRKKFEEIMRPVIRGMKGAGKYIDSTHGFFCYG